MTPPGEPLKFGQGAAIRRQFANYEKEFPGLEQQVMTAIADEAPHTITALWKKKAKAGHVIRGAKVTVEAKNKSGKTAILDAMFVKGNDLRSVVRIKQGSYDGKDAAQFCAEYGGEPEGKGGRL